MYYYGIYERPNRAIHTTCTVICKSELSLTYVLRAIIYALLRITTECSLLSLVIRHTGQRIWCRAFFHPINKRKEGVILRIVGNKCWSRLTEIDRADTSGTVIHPRHLEKPVEWVEIRHFQSAAHKVVEALRVSRGDQLKEICLAYHGGVSIGSSNLHYHDDRGR